MVMIFTLVSAAQEKLVEVMEAIKQLKEEEQKRIEAEIKRQTEVSSRENNFLDCSCLICGLTSLRQSSMVLQSLGSLLWSGENDLMKK